MNHKLWHFRDFELDRATFSLRRFGVSVKLDPKPLELLFLLAERGGAVVSHEEALRQVWGENVFVDGESAIYTAVKKIRQALGDADLVQTVSRRGYRLRVEEVAAVSQTDKPPASERIAILPLTNLSGDPAQDYFSDGLTEELIATMARIFRGQLGVIARTSVMRFKAVSRPIEEIACDLGANYVIEGSVRRQNQRVRIAVQLFRAADATCLWSETFERPTDDVFALQTEISLATASAIRTTITDEDKTPKTTTIDPEIHDRYLRARHLWVQRTRPTIESAMQYFRETLSRDRAFAPAYAGLSCCYAILPITSNQRPSECFPQAQALATQAIALDQTQTEAHVALGLVEFWYHRNWHAALRYFRQAAALNPSDSLGPMFLAHVYSVLGHHDLALATIANAHRLDPLSPIVGTHEGHFLYNAGRFQDALRPLERVLELNPQFWIAHLMQGKALSSIGNLPASLEAFDQAHRLGMGNTEAMCFRIHTLAKNGEDNRVRDAIEQMETMHLVQPVPPLHRALARLGMGDRHAALDLIEEGFVDHDVRLVFLGVEARWRDLGESTYSALLDRAGLNPLLLSSLA
jgi:TolB-like protein